MPFELNNFVKVQGNRQQGCCFHQAIDNFFNFFFPTLKSDLVF